MTTETLTFPIAGVSDDATATFVVPVDWRADVESLAPKMLYGPGYVRSVLPNLQAMSSAVVDGDMEQAERWLDAAIARAERSGR